MTEASAVTIGFGLALALTSLLAAKSPQKVASLGALSMLGFGWAIAVVTAPIAAKTPEIMLTWTVADAVFGATVVWMWSRYLKAWLIMLAMVYFAQCFVHVLYWSGHIPSLYHYQVGLNVLLSLQIICVAWPGAEHVARRLVRSLFPTPRDHHRSRPRHGEGR